ncbi:MAG: nucleotide pyrophosphohydrolase [Candidatus Poseidoniales archaeon]|nr:MAG: nucleotide pyrophosphohydrolase [Candidatus Poseidoniales archaeon]
MSSTDSLQDTIAVIDKFTSERDWEQFHTVKNLVASISIEAAELSETIQWVNPTEVEVLQDQRLVQNISHELADVMVYCLNLCSKLELDPIKIIHEKMKHNAEKYPVEKSFGNFKKYSEY